MLITASIPASSSSVSDSCPSSFPTMFPLALSGRSVSRRVCAPLNASAINCAVAEAADVISKFKFQLQEFGFVSELVIRVIYSNQPEPCTRFVDTNAMKSPDLLTSSPIFRRKLVRAMAMSLLVILAACGSQAAEATQNPSPVTAPLTCPDCAIVDVVDVIDANTLNTSIGEIEMYGAYVVDQPADCASLAKERLQSLAGSSIRVEPGPVDSIRISTNHYYLYTVDGVSIEDQLVHEGLALVWSQDGQHVGWFLFQDAAAKAADAGCLWRGYQAFQRGEPSDFRIPGLTYPESASTE
jgi:endonuclease YncB( thermonuclease family)